MWRDWVLLGLAVPTAVVETFVNPEIRYPVASLIVTLSLLPLMLWRRDRTRSPSWSIAFGAMVLSNLVAIMLPGRSAATRWPSCMILPYSLFRWGIGTGGHDRPGFLILATWFTSMVAEWNGHR